MLIGVYSTPELGFLAKNEWVWTEKVDGQNIKIEWDGERVSIGGHTAKSQINPYLLPTLEELFLGEEKEEVFEQRFGSTPVTLFGEGFGEKIQTGGGKYGKPNFILFDAVCGDMWLRRESVKEIGGYFHIPVVPVVGHGDLNEAEEFIRSMPRSMLKDDIMEGIVCRPETELLDRAGRRIIVKIKCRDFKGGGEL